MPAHKRKPNYNGATTMQELLTAVCDYYGDPVDDRKSEDLDHVSLHDVADRFNITVMKARKLLITGGLFIFMFDAVGVQVNMILLQETIIHNPTNTFKTAKLVQNALTA